MTLINDTELRRLRQQMPSQLMEATVLDPPLDAQGFLRVEIDNRPGAVEACPWTPRVDVDPAKGDAAAVVESDGGHFWVVAWWKQTAGVPSGFVTDTELAAHAALETGVHGIPAMANGQGLLWNGSDWVATDLATQAELDAIKSPVVTSLPGSPFDGQQVLYRFTQSVVPADARVTTWHLIFNSALGKWEVIGAPALHAEVATASQESTAAGYVALTTPGPAITLPLPGDYDIETSFVGYQAANGGSLLMSYDIGGTGAVDADAVTMTLVVTNGPNMLRGTRTKRKAGLSAVTLTAKYKALTGTANFAGTSNIGGATRYMRATPIRVG